MNDAERYDELYWYFMGTLSTKDRPKLSELLDLYLNLEGGRLG